MATSGATKKPSGSSAISQSSVRYLSYEDIELVAFEVANHFATEPIHSLQLLGGQQGRGVLQGIVELPKQTIGGEDAYPSIFDKAAVLLRSIALDHPFVDGNKRMALGAAVAFLARNDWLIDATGEELVELVLSVVTGRNRDLAALARWFHAHAFPR